MSGDNALWCSVLKGKYDRVNLLMDEVVSKPNDSSLWKNLVQLWPKIESLVLWSVGNGDAIHAWDQCWIEAG